jgi:hypothetical protein
MGNNYKITLNGQQKEYSRAEYNNLYRSNPEAVKTSPEYAERKSNAAQYILGKLEERKKSIADKEAKVTAWAAIKNTETGNVPDVSGWYLPAEFSYICDFRTRRFIKGKNLTIEPDYNELGYVLKMNEDSCLDGLLPKGAKFIEMRVALIGEQVSSEDVIEPSTKLTFFVEKNTIFCEFAVQHAFELGGRIYITKVIALGKYLGKPPHAPKYRFYGLYFVATEAYWSSSFRRTLARLAREVFNQGK